MGTVEELKHEAAELGIAGSPSMKKAELEEAIESAKAADAQVRVEAATERNEDGQVDLARHVTAHDVPKADPEAEDAAMPFRTPKAPSKGAMELVYREIPYSPVACGVHRSAEVGHSPEGYQPGCDGCAEQLSMIVEHIRRVA